MKIITDIMSLTGAKTRFDNDIPIYDDGYGPLFIHMDSMGISGIVRAQTWEDAYGICEDEFFPEASETVEELRKEYNFKLEHVKIIKPLDGGPERPDCRADYPPPTGRLQPGQFVRWETRETPCEDEYGWADNELFQEAFGFRPNGPNQKDTHKHGIYAKDLNGDSLDQITWTLLREHEITLTLKAEAVLPAYWGSYLINCDDSGLEPREKEFIDRWLESQSLPKPVGVGEQRFSRYNDATDLGGDVCDYEFLIIRTGKQPGEDSAQ